MLKDHTSQRKKKERLYNEWCKKVFKPIQSQVEQSLEERTTSEIEERRRAMFEEFLNVTNKKEGLFRDIIKEETYNPLKGHEHTIKYSTKNIQDPLKSDLTKAEQETKIISALNPDQETIRPKNREVLDLVMWDKLDATPHGRYQMMFQENKKTQRIGTKSTLTLDHYKVETDPSIAKGEFFPKGKKTYGSKEQRPVDIISNKFGNSQMQRPIHDPPNVM